MNKLVKLTLDWGIEGLKAALKDNCNVVIIDQLRFSSTVVTATALGFVIEPTSDKSRKSESFSLSPSSFLNKAPVRVVIVSPNGAYLSINAKGGKQVAYGSVLNAKAVGEWIDQMGEDIVLVAAGEVYDSVRLGFMDQRELELSKKNKIFAVEDFLAAGAIAHFSKMNKSQECKWAMEEFERLEHRLVDELKNTASSRYNESRGMGQDTLDCAKLNFYNVVPKLHFVNGVPEIRAD